jgi:hypothetical protein
VGDTLYGAAGRLRIDDVTLAPLERNFLHAAKLGFRQPRTGAWIDVRASLPEALHEFLLKLCTVSGESPAMIDAALAPYL